MATYKEIFGKQIKFLSSDPANEAEGQIWYNSTTGTFRSALVTEAWSASTSLPEARASGGGCGTQTAGVQAGGLGGPPSSTSTSFEYNGAGWADGGALPAVRRNNSMFGTQTAAVSAGTLPAATNVDTYNGASWTAGTAYPAVVLDLGVAGTQTAGLAWGGDQDPGLLTTTNEYNGSWTAGGAIPVGTSASGCLGTQTAALSIGGLQGPAPPGSVNTCIEYNGASWAAATAYPIAVSSSGGAGTQTAGLGFAGYLVPGVTAVTNSYDGTSWTASGALVTARYMSTQGLGATNTAALAAGGNTPTRIATVEEFNRSANVITPAAWASGGSLGSARYAMSGVGPQTAALGAMGYSSSGKPASWKYTEEYNGTSWAEQSDMSVARFSGGAFGTQTAAVFAGGNLDPGLSNAVEEYNGASWTAGTVLPAVRSAAPGFGVETAGVICGGSLPTATDTSLEYNGASWAAGGTMPTVGGGECTGSGIITAGLFVLTEPAPVMGAAYEYDGTNWTVGGATIAGLPGRGAATAGAQDAGLIFGGGPATSTLTEGYDGTAWSTRPSLATGRRRVAGAGTSTAGLAFGGRTPPTSAGSTATEEFTGETSTLNYETITTS